jgi:hypothetical protein
MYSLRIQVVVQVAAYYEQAFDKGISGAWCHRKNGGRRVGIGLKRGI